MSAAFNAIMQSETKESLAHLYLAQLGVQRELVDALKVLLEREKEDRENYLECATVPVLISKEPLVFGAPDPSTLDEDGKEVLADFDSVIAKAEAAKAGVS